jgi:hypothetical protein
MRNSKSVDLRTDIYSLGVVLYQLIAGRPPIEAETLGELAERVFTGAIAPLRSRVPQVSVELDAVIMRCLEKKAEDRFSSIAELASALATATDEQHATAGSAPIARASASALATTANASTTGQASPAPTIGLDTTAPASAVAPPVATAQPASVPAAISHQVTSPAHGRADPSDSPRRLQTAGVVGGALACLGVGFALLRPAATRPVIVPELAVVTVPATGAPPSAASPVSPPPLAPAPAIPGSPAAPIAPQPSPPASVLAAAASQPNAPGPRSSATKPASSLPAATSSATRKPPGPGGYDPFGN